MDIIVTHSDRPDTYGNWQDPRTARISFANGNCVKVWQSARKASSCDGGACIRVAEAPELTLIGVSDSQSTSDLVLAFTVSAWRQFTGRVRIAPQSDVWVASSRHGRLIDAI
jgi:hypothetical protein